MSSDFSSSTEPTLPELLVQMDDWLHKDANFLANVCNVSAFLYHTLPDISWLGWYVTETIGGDLTLGPFQGPPTLSRLAWGKGVAGSAAFERAVQIVEDIRRFRGNVKDGLDTRSEVAIPVIQSGLVRSVLSVKSKTVARFGVFEVELLRELAGRVGEKWPAQARGLGLTGDSNEGGIKS